MVTQCIEEHTIPLLLQSTSVGKTFPVSHIVNSVCLGTVMICQHNYFKVMVRPIELSIDIIIYLYESETKSGMMEYGW